MWKKAFCFVLVFSLFISSFGATKGKVSAEMNGTSTWLWDTEAIITQGDKILSFLQQNHVGQVYLQVNPQLNHNVYRSFIEKATNKKIKIHALDGAPNWVANGGNKHQDQFFAWIKQYQKSASSNQKFSGVHLDVEPYIASGWSTDYNGTVLSYQQLIKKAVQYSKQLNIPLGVDIPFWFDEKSFNNKFGKGSLASWVIQTVDSITIMAYRDKANGPNGIIELVSNEVDLCKKYRKPLIIGVETGESSEANYVTFYEEGQAYMLSQLNQVQATYPSQKIAIHSLQSWMLMKP